MMDEIYMREAFKQARMAFELDEVPVGAVIVFENQMIAKAHNQVETLKDPTAHAEILAITSASNYLSSKWLHKCTMYVTMEPCCMCAGALVLSRIDRLFIGTMDPKSGACGSVLNISHHQLLNHRIEVAQGLLENECSQIVKDFFQRKRQLKSQ